MSRVFRRWIWLAAICPFLIVGSIYFRASKAAQDAAAEVAADGRVRLDLVNLDRRALAGVDLIEAAPLFRDVAVFEGRVFISSASGLSVHDAAHATKTWRAGIELPAGRLGAMTVISLHGSSSKELLIATDGGGILRFDGSRFRQVLPQRAELRHVTSLLALNTGRVLFGTESAGVGVYDGDNITMLDPLLASEHITAIVGSDQDLWIGTLLHGCWHLHAGQMEHVKDALPDPQVLSLATHGDRAYIGTPLGVVEFQGGHKLRTLAEGTFARSLAADSDNLTIGTEDEGIFEVPLASRSRALSNDSKLVGESILRIVILSGATYCLTSTSVYRKSETRWERVTLAQKSVLTDRHVAALSLGAQSNLWVGYFDRGLDILSGNHESVRHLEDDHLFCVNRIVHDGGTRTAVATANGLVMFGGDQVRQVLNRKDGLIADHVTDVAFSRDGLIAATPAGISFVDTSGVRSVYVFQGLVNNHVYALGLAGDQLLAGTLGGVSVLDHEVIHANYTTANSALKHNWITALVRVGDEWFAGTYGAGVVRMDAHGEWHNFPDLNSKFVVNPGAMLVADGRVYAGSLDRGLYIYDLNVGRWRNTTTGLPSLNVTAFTSSRNAVYVGTDNGLVRFEEQGLQ